MKNLKNKITLLLTLLILSGSSIANSPPDGVSSEQWGKIKQQIMASKYYPQVDKEGFYTAHNPAKGWQIHYATDGMTTIKNNDYRIGMRLQSIGALHLDTKPSIEVVDNTLYYHHSPQIKEWWVNSADKVEQWFSIKKRPITGSHKLKVKIGIDTDTQVSQSGNQLTFTNHKGQSINYNKLKVWDSRGAILSSRMQLADNNESFHLIVNDSQAIYPITIDPSFSQTDYIKPTIIDAYDQFGYSVDIDGDIMVIGSPSENSSANIINGNSSDNSAAVAGAAYVFVYSEAYGWQQQAYLKASNAEAIDLFGQSVAVSGNTIVVGAAFEDGDINSTAIVPNNNQPRTGAVYVFALNGLIWRQQAYLKASNAETIDYFGESVAIDGDIIVVGSKWEDGDANSTMLSTNNNATSAGAAYVFARNGVVWTQKAYLKASNAEAFDQFGNSVSIARDTIVVGAQHEHGDANSTIGAFNNDASEAGAVYVFTRSGSVWAQQAYLKASNAEAFDDFGYSVDIDGDTIVVGAINEDGDVFSAFGSTNNNELNSGATYVFARSSDTWSQQAYLKAGNAETTDAFGISVAIAGDSVVVGAYLEDGDSASSMDSPNNNSTDSGATYVFSRNGSDWQQKNYLKAQNLSSLNLFGSAVAINEGNIVTGAWGENGDASSTMELPNENAMTSGAAYVYKGQYYIGGNVVGLPFGQTVDLLLDSTEVLSVTNHRPFKFVTDVPPASTYSVSISSAPAGYTCSIINAIGTVGYDDVTDVGIFCSTSSYNVSGTVTGLIGTGLVLRNSITDLNIYADGSFVLAPDLADGTPYEVVVINQPNDQTCTVSNASGTIAGADVTDIEVTCTINTYFIGGTIMGAAADGLVLQNNDSDDLTITHNGGFVFSQPLIDNSSYAVTVTSKPIFQNCTVIHASGTIASNDVIDVEIICTNSSYIIGASVVGLTGPGLVLQNNGGDDLNINANGNTPFNTRISSGSSFNATILSQPDDSSNTCLINGVSSGIVAGNHVLLSIVCS